jgi:hypothetical protein
MSSPLPYRDIDVSVARKSPQGVVISAYSNASRSAIFIVPQEAGVVWRLRSGPS